MIRACYAYVIMTKEGSHAGGTGDEMPKIDERQLIEILSNSETTMSREAMEHYLKFVDQCDLEMEKEIAGSDRSAKTIHIAQIRCNFKQAKLLSQSGRFKQQGLEDLYDCAYQAGQDPDIEAELGLDIHLAIIKAEEELDIRGGLDE
jgi:hypothetical protein